MNERQTLGDKISHFRKEVKLSQEAFAFRIGVTRRTLSLWENDKRSPKADMIERICNEFGADINYFFPSDKTFATAEAMATETPGHKDNNVLAIMVIAVLSLVLLIAIGVLIISIIIIKDSRNVTTVSSVVYFDWFILIVVISSLVIFAVLASIFILLYRIKKHKK